MNSYVCFSYRYLPKIDALKEKKFWKTSGKKGWKHRIFVCQSEGKVRILSESYWIRPGPDLHQIGSGSPILSEAEFSKNVPTAQLYNS